MPEKWSKWQRWTTVKCPHCECHHDLTPFDYVLMAMRDAATKNQRDIPVFRCELIRDGRDVGCGRKFEVVQVDQPVLVRVRPAKDDAGEFKHIQTESERLAFEQTEIWREMQAKKPRV
jgi:hypothetical protein